MLLDEEMPDSERHELEQAEQVCRAFLEWDLNADGEHVKSRLGQVLRTDPET
jgi:DNA mismatch repair protein MSH5